MLRFAGDGSTNRKSGNAAVKSGKCRLHSQGCFAYIARSFGKKIYFMRRPKGIKTKKSVSKRFKITAGGKVLRHRAGRRHLCQTKSPKRRRSLRGPHLVHETDVYR